MDLKRYRRHRDAVSRHSTYSKSRSTVNNKRKLAARSRGMRLNANFPAPLMKKYLRWNKRKATAPFFHQPAMKTHNYSPRNRYQHLLEVDNRERSTYLLKYFYFIRYVARDTRGRIKRNASRDWILRLHSKQQWTVIFLFDWWGGNMRDTCTSKLYIIYMYNSYYINLLRWNDADRELFAPNCNVFFSVKCI